MFSARAYTIKIYTGLYIKFRLTFYLMFGKKYIYILLT